jgi:hypothetical protein
MYRTRHAQAELIETNWLEKLMRIHDLRDSQTSMKAQEQEDVDSVVAYYDREGMIPDVGTGALALGVARITRRQGRESVSKTGIAALRDRLGDEAEEYIVRYKSPTVISHIDPALIELILKSRI